MDEALQSAIDQQIAAIISEEKRKYRQLGELFQDAKVREFARKLLLQETPEQPKPPEKRRGRKRGPLVDRVFAIVDRSDKYLVSSEITEQMENEGFESFPSEDHEKRKVAVSKALRGLAAEGKIDHKQEGHAKSAILYRRLTQVPVRDSSA